MAFTNILMQNPLTGARKEAPVGLSWTVLFFGFLPPLFRGDLKWGLIMLAFWLLTAGVLVHLVFMFFYNKLYIKDLLAEGYQLQSLDESQRQKIIDNLGMSLPEAGRPG